MTNSADFNNAVQSFPAAGRALLAELTAKDDFAGVFTADAAHALADLSGLSRPKLLLALVPIARCFAHPPISRYRAGAVILGASGRLILGANQEFPGLALNATVHAEQAAVLHALRLEEAGISALAVGGSPCGHCRQFLCEINHPRLQIITPQGARPLSEMLPDAFSPRTLGNEQGLFEPAEQALSLPAEASAEAATAAALAAARRSYAPYSGNRAGLAVSTAAGDIVAAPYIESVAFNPSLSPLQGALVLMRMRRLPWSDIRRVVLVESAGSLCSQEPATRELLELLGESPLDVRRY